MFLKFHIQEKQRSGIICKVNVFFDCPMLENRYHFRKFATWKSIKYPQGNIALPLSIQ